jgi:hypothetical protein
MQQSFIIVALKGYRTPDSHTHRPITYLGPIMKDRESCMCQMHGHMDRARGYMYFEKMN